jgi:1,4-alpha-glucan branching enzyme
MGLTAPRNRGYIGGITTLKFDEKVSDLELTINDVYFHAEEGDAGPADTFTVDLNGFQPGAELHLVVSYERPDGTRSSNGIVVFKPNDYLGGMGATVVKVDNDISGAFFKFWLPSVKRVFVRGSFNGWRDVNRLDQLGATGYWFGFCGDAKPDDDYKFFVYGLDDKFSEVSDPAARETIKTDYNAPDAQDANAVIVDPGDFGWRHDGDYLGERRDFRRTVIYQAHWGTFLRTGTNLPYETFVTQAEHATEDDKRESVRRKLEYVRDLGFTALELLPIQESNGNTNAGYDPSFFYAVESTYGTPDELRMLVDEAHGLGLAVIFDSVINHLTAELTHSSFSQPFIRGWYTRVDAPWSNERQWGGDDWGPDPDYDRYEIRNLLTDSILMYIEEFHVDGIRFDATTCIPDFALKEMIGRLRGDSRTCNAYLIAEHLTDDPLPYVVGEVGFRGGWYKPAYYAAMDGVLRQMGRGDLDSVRKAFESNYLGEPSTAIKYCTGSHDEIWKEHQGMSTTARLGGSGNEYARMKMRLAWALAASSLGTPMMFMGTECMDDTGWGNSSGYGEMNWHAETGSNGANFKQMIQDINHLRRDHGALRGANIDAKLVHWDNDNGVVAYKRWDQSGGVFLIVINVSDNNWGGREYQVRCDTPDSDWHECFNSQYVNYGGWTGACNSDPTFYPHADDSGLLQGINVAKWSLQILKKR